MKTIVIQVDDKGSFGVQSPFDLFTTTGILAAAQAKLYMDAFSPKSKVIVPDGVPPGDLRG